MKVKDLIEKLSKLDPDTLVALYDGLDCGYHPLGSVVGGHIVYEVHDRAGRIVNSPVGDSEPCVTFYSKAKF